MDYHKLENTNYLAFLDIDGVFTSARVQFGGPNPHDMWNRFDPVAVDFMNRLHDRVDGLKFVLISTWKENLSMNETMNIQWILAAFRNAGFRGDFFYPWKTNPYNDKELQKPGMNRADEIKDYLANYGTGIRDFIIFDDNDYGFDKVLGKKRFIRTDPENGMLLRHMKDALSLVGNWLEK